MKRNILFLGIMASLNLVSCNDKADDDSRTEVTTVSSADSSVSSPAFNMSEARAAIDADNALFMDHVRKGDSAALAEHYHSDAQMLMAGSEPITRANIAATMGGMFRMGIKDLKLTTTDLVGNDELLVETGTLELFDDKKVSLDKGKYVVAWRKENGKWKIYRDIMNSSTPEPQHK